MARWILRLLIFAAVVLAAGLVYRVAFAPDPVRVAARAVEPGLVRETVTNTRAGTLRAARRALLSPEVGGQVRAIPHREGEWVDAGALLLQLDDSAQRARESLALRESAAAEADRERACLAADRAVRELARGRALAADQILAVDALDALETAQLEAAAACRSAAAQVERFRSAVAVARAEVTKMALRAPFAGVVAEVATEVGEWTTPSPPALPVPAVIDLLDASSLYVSAPLDEVDSARLAVGQQAIVSVDSFRDRTFAGRVRRIAPYVLDVEEQNRTVEVEVELLETDSRFLPGTSADVEIVLAERPDSLRVPTAALIEEHAVLILADGVLQRRDIETGLSNWDFTEVTGGVERGELVVTSLDDPKVLAGAAAELETGR